MSRPKCGSLVPNGPPFRKRSTVCQLPLQAAAEMSASSTTAPASPMVIARDASGISNWPMRRTGTCGAIRRASQMLASAGTAKATKPMANRASCDHSLVVTIPDRPSAPYHIRSVARATDRPRMPNANSRTRTAMTISAQRRTGAGPVLRRPGNRTGRSSSGGSPSPPPPFVRRGNGRPSRRASCSAWRRWSSSSSLSNQVDIGCANRSGQAALP